MQLIQSSFQMEQNHIVERKERKMIYLGNVNHKKAEVAILVAD